MTSNRALHAASLAQQDEFYTRFNDVQEELGHYWEHFRGAKILCNCDDPFESSFFRYFALQFAYLGIKKLTATCYAGSPIAHTQLELNFGETPPCLPLAGEEQVPPVKGGFRGVMSPLSGAVAVAAITPPGLPLSGAVQVPAITPPGLPLSGAGQVPAITPPGLTLSGAGQVPPQFRGVRKPYCATITDYRDWNGDGRTDLLDIRYMLEHQIGCTVRVLDGDGDFRSPECVELLKDADIVCTNPPFSLFREFVALMMKYNKKFLILGNKNAVTYKEIFPLIQQGKIWLGHRNMNSDFWLEVPSYENYEKVDEDGRRLKHIMACWYTNLPLTKRHEFLTLLYPYTPEAYPRYDNYDAIEVSRTDRIPYGYDGVMGVPITFLDKYNPDQFEIVGFRKGDDGKDLRYTKDGKQVYPYMRILIRKKQYDENGSFYVIKHYGQQNTPPA